MGFDTFTERKMSEEIFTHFSGRNMNVFAEVPFMSRVIDMVMLDGEKVTTIELKLRNWKKAIKQLKQHMIASHYNYLCMPSITNEQLTDKIVGHLKEYGFGFLLWDREKQELTTLLKAERSEYISNCATDKLTANIKTMVDYA